MSKQCERDGGSLQFFLFCKRATSASQQHPNQDQETLAAARLFLGIPPILRHCALLVRRPTASQAVTSPYFSPRRLSRKTTQDDDLAKMAKPAAEAALGHAAEAAVQTLVMAEAAEAAKVAEAAEAAKVAEAAEADT